MNKFLILITLLVTFSYAQADLHWMKESQKRLSWKDAIEYCQKNNAKLPTLRQMFEIWEKHDRTSEVAGFDLSVSYWTSTEVKDNKRAAYPFYFGTGKEGWYYKEDHYGVRCIK